MERGDQGGFLRFKVAGDAFPVVEEGPTSRGNFCRPERDTDVNGASDLRRGGKRSKGVLQTLGNAEELHR